MTDRARYPTLFDRQERDWARWVSFVFEAEPPLRELVSNVRILCFVGDDVVLMHTEDFGPVGLPGGTLEPDESIEDGLARELIEEIRARATSFDLPARLRFHNHDETPYRPHLPHPESHWALGFGDVEILGAPTMPEDGERVLHIDVVPVEHACRVLREADKPWEAELVHFLASMRNARGTRPFPPDVR